MINIFELQHIKYYDIKNNKIIINWHNMCEYQKLSDNFVEKYKDKLNWKILDIDNLSDKIIKKYKDELKHNLSFKRGREIIWEEN